MEILIEIPKGSPREFPRGTIREILKLLEDFVKGSGRDARKTLRIMLDNAGKSEINPVNYFSINPRQTPAEILRGILIGGTDKSR